MKIKLTENQFQRIVKEMRFDGKSTGLFSEEEPIKKYDPTKVVHKDDEHVVLDLDQDDEFTYDEDDISYQDNDWLVIDVDDDEMGKYMGNNDIDADGIPDDEDDVLAVDRFDIEQRIKSTMNEYFADSYEDKYDKWDKLERDVDSCIRSIIETHKDNFGHDSYAVIDAIYQVMDGMFQKV